MIKRKRFFSASLAVVMVLSLCSGCSKKDSLPDDLSPSANSAAQPPQYDGAVQEPGDGIGEPGKDFVLLKTGEANDWGDVSIPKFNPLGSYALYSSVEEAVDSTSSVAMYTLDGYTEKWENKLGKVWTLSITDPDYSLYWLRWYVREAGGRWFPGTRDHSTFLIQESDAISWWADAQQTEDGVILQVVKVHTLAIGKPLTVKPEGEAGEYVFYTPETNGKLQSATITLKGAVDSGVALGISSERKWGRYSYQTNMLLHSADLNLKKTGRFVLDNLPITEGELCWKLTWDHNAPVPEEVTIQLDVVADIPTVKWGETPGAIRVVGAPTGRTAVRNPAWATLEHSEVKIVNGEAMGFSDEKGALFFPAPAGYYQVEFDIGVPDGVGMNRLVPVNSGEVTTVTIPREAKAASGALSRMFGDFEQNRGGIELLDHAVSGDMAKATFVLNDPLERDMFPKKEEVKISEEGIAAVVTEIQRQPVGSNVVLVLDSSGSMGENMKPCVEAAKRFVQTLPENATIQLIQFAQQITKHQGSDKASVLKALDTVQAGGATSLYDATAQALSLLADRERGYAVVFSDGADSREPGVDGEGSQITKDAIIEQIAASKVAVLTIGFGAGHDPSTLVAMSSASSNGGYFAAADKNALDGAFASVAGKFGNQFTVTYERPAVPQDQSGTMPVVSLMIDTSGSMDIDPLESPGNDVGFRMDRVKSVFHDFILKLPEGTLMQHGNFASPGDFGCLPMGYQQYTTDQKSSILQALGSLYGEGGTPTNEALNLAYFNLSAVPSQKRVLVFFTDMALYDPKFPEEHDNVLAKLKASGIQVLFVGLSDQSDNAGMKRIFETSAKKAGGDYLLTSSPEEIGKKLDELLAKLGTPSPKYGVDFTLGIDCSTADGDRASFYTAQTLENLKPKTGAAKQLDPQLVQISTGERHVVYDNKAATLLYGGDQPGTESNVLLRMPFSNKQGGNAFGKLSVSEAYLMDVFKGIPAPSGKMYLALNLSLAFSKADKAAKEIGYSVPNVFNHFYISADEGRMQPPSSASYLAEQPFVNPGDAEVIVFDQEPRSGALVFLVDKADEKQFEQLSLHFYDTLHGHIAIPLIGRLTEQMLQMEKLPTEEPQQMGQAFALVLTGQTDQTALAGVMLEQEDSAYSPLSAQRNASFRVLEARFDSKVQALLDIDPIERFYYRLQTNHGELMTPMSPVVHHLPLGFVGKTMLAPGSCSNVRMPFALPNELLDTMSTIYADLATGSKEWLVTNGSPYQTQSLNKKYSHQSFDLTINELAIMEENSSSVVLDFILHDKKDGEGTGGLESILQLERDSPLEDGAVPGSKLIVAGRSGLANFSDGNSDLQTADLYATKSLIFGAVEENGTWGAFDGQSRRGILVFGLDGGEISDWRLTSSLLPDLKLPVSAAPYSNPALLAKKPDIQVDESFDKALEEAVSGAITAYQATNPKAPALTPVGLSDDEILGEQVSAPSLTLYGSQQLRAVRTDADFLALMRSQKWIGTQANSSWDAPKYRYAPEAVLTQGWGGQNDLAVLARTLLARLGYKPKYRTVTMTDAGIKELQKLCAMEGVPEKIVSVFYYDAQGVQKLFVPIFNVELSELSGLAYLATDGQEVAVEPAIGTIAIGLYGKVVGNAGNLMQANTDLWGSLGAAMEGDEAESGYYETVPILERQVSMPDMSLDAIDISYLATPKPEGGSLLLPILDTPQGLLYDPDGWIDSSYYEFQRLTMTLNDGNATANHITILTPEQKLHEITHTLAWGVPELSPQAAKSIEDMAKSQAKSVKQPSNYSVCRWLGHETIDRLVWGLSGASRDIAGELGLIAGRADQAIALLVTTKSDGKTAQTTVDLMSHRNELHSGENTTRNAYNLMYGYFASDMEAFALPNGNGYGYTKVWNSLPDGSKVNPIFVESMEDYDAATAKFGKENYPTLLWERMRGQDNAVQPKVLYLVPDHPAVVEGKPRWAWLEIDLESYDVISVFETGERAGMGEYLIGCMPGNGNYGEVGAGLLVGITTSVGTVSAYTLTGEDYKTVLALAKNKCVEIGKYIAGVSDAVGYIDAGGKFKEGLQGGYEWDEWISIKWEKLFEGAEGLLANKLTFKDGYNFAIEAYFKRI